MSTLLVSRAELLLVVRADFISFGELSFYELNPGKTFKPAAYLELIAAKLEACRLGKIRRLIITLPPRSLKSHLVSIAWPAWLLGHDPSAQIICCSYGAELAENFARQTRTLMQSRRYQELFSTRLTRQAVHDIQTTAGGSRWATSVGGPLTGLGAQFIIIDDPLKPDEALSKASRDAVNNWYDNTLVSRLNDKTTGCIVIVTQRTHTDDLVGHVLENH